MGRGGAGFGRTDRLSVRRILPAAIALLLAAVSPAGAQRVALVIGNASYQAVPALRNPPRDAEVMAEALRHLEFRVEVLHNAGRGEMLAALRRLAQAATGAEAALLFYAGHAVEVGGSNMLLGVTTSPRAAEIERDAVAYEEVERLLAGRAGITMIFLDSCRDNPFAAALARAQRADERRGGTRSVGAGLAGVASASGMLIAFATAPGRVALDGDAGNSPFTAALVRHIASEDLEVRQMLGRVRRTVREGTGGRQVPWDNSSLEGEFFFRSSVPVARQAPPAAAAPRARLSITPQREVQVTPDEYLRAITGNTLEFIANTGVPVRSFVSPDGTLHMRYGQLRGRGFNDQGVYSIEGATFCTRFGRFRQGRTLCIIPFRDGDGWGARTPDGQRVEISIRRGDPYRLAP